jgi:hypothetical protein
MADTSVGADEQGVAQSSERTLPTVNARDRRLANTANDHGGAESAERKQALNRVASGGGDLQAAALVVGPTASGTSAKTASSAGYRLNPAFSLWLMGYLDEWISCGDRAMQSFRRSRRRS